MLVTDYTLRKIMSANDQDIVALTGRAHCQRQVAFFPDVTQLATQIPERSHVINHNDHSFVTH